MEYDIIDLLFVEHKNHLDSIDTLETLFKTARESLNLKALDMFERKIKEVCLELDLHFKKEEEGLFIFLYEKTQDRDGLIKSLIVEHRQIKDLCKDILSLVEEIKQNNNKWLELRNSLNSLLHQINDHVLKENMPLLKIASQELDKETLIKGYYIAEDIEKKFFS
ncbi:MAG: hemerythrin domain-containing protein [Aquificae bacterium]|nr:hemerythrin domain-containing protein [Aquificota bacterium]